ncbi:MAG: hypothetical protein AAGF81_12170 [Pseudomonadota bacterium]
MSLVLSALFTALAYAGAPEVNLGHFNKLAMNGYDVMTYWKGGKPLEGKKEISASYNGATWVFISAENRATFLEDPARYAPPIWRLLRLCRQPQCGGGRGPLRLAHLEGQTLSQLQPPRAPPMGQRH